VRRPGFRPHFQRITQPENRINERIRVPKVRVIGAEGEQIGILMTSEALERARELELDLVEVAPTADPPVCKIMDYGKFRYQQQKRAHDAKRKQTVIQVKEIKVHPKIDTHDYQFKLEHVKRFLANGDKAKVSVVFRGREIVHRDIGEKLLERFREDTKEFGDVETMPKLEGKNLSMILTAKPQKEKKQNSPN